MSVKTRIIGEKINLLVGTIDIDGSNMIGACLKIKLDGKPVIVRGLSIKFSEGDWRIIADIVPVPAPEE